MGLITTNEARCRDCYRCLRGCAVKAIRFSAGDESGVLHARVIEELCVHDAWCVFSCPQRAKKVASDLEQVRNLLRQGRPLAAGVAPSFVAGLPLDDPGKMPALLRKLGFGRVQETSLGAGLVVREHRRMGFDRPLVSSACPVVVNLIESHYPELLPVLARQRLDGLINPENFIRVIETGEMLNRLHSYPELDIITREIIFPLESEKAVVGILVDITSEKRQREQFELVKGQTIARAQEVLAKQMTVAQEIAGLLGETTAETKVLLSKLIDLMLKGETRADESLRGYRNRPVEKRR